MPRENTHPDALQVLLDPSFSEITEDEIARLREDILNQLGGLNLPSWASGNNASAISKEAIRTMHEVQRREVLRRELPALWQQLPTLLHYFADGHEVHPELIDPELVPVREGVATDLFRLATLLWSVPVSKGYGRRMRYLVRDRSNGKLIGLFGLADPVFNLRARDQWIGWNAMQRRAGLVHVMDAYVVGSVPPYSYLLGGKLVASLIASAEVGEAFARRYSETKGIISGKHKRARLVLVTVTSALGRSSMYNRLRLFSLSQDILRPRVLVELIRLGSTTGYGHFHLSEGLFRRLRNLVKYRGHRYADAHKYGDGPNWRIRVSRVGLSILGLDPDLIRHGIMREIYAMPLASNCCDFLCGRVDEARLDRPLLQEIAAAAIERWILPRADRFPDFKKFSSGEILELLRLSV